MPEYRVRVDAVRRLLHVDGWDTSGIDDAQILGFVDDANLLVDEELAGAGHSDRRLAKLEARLAGHYLLASGMEELRQTTSGQSADGATQSFGGDIGHEGLRGTTLGQQALELDTSGRLAALADASTPGAGTDFEFRVF